MSKLDTRILNEASAGELIERNETIRWDGWDIVLFTASPGAFFKRDGVFNRTVRKWGFEERVSPDKNGNWKVRIAPINRRRP